MTFNYLAILQRKFTIPLMAVLFCASSIDAIAKQSPEFVGTWALNQAETELLRDDLDEKTIKIPTAGRAQISVMGIPLPGGGASTRSGHSPLTAKQPEVLRCKTMTISTRENLVELFYPDLDPQEQREILRAGHYRGRDSKWSRKRLQQKYKTSERSVSKKWSMRKDGRLLVEVAIKHKKAKKLTFRRVFDRVAAK
tara:strand:- start:273 stop:860 length:588 start_codon:yes stop_codon:yes gene_type:complete